MSLEKYADEDVRSELLAKKIDEYSSQDVAEMLMKESLQQVNAMACDFSI